VEPDEADLVRQRLDKHVSEATDTHATTEELLEVVFSVRSVLRLYSESRREFWKADGVMAVFNSIIIQFL
jgi:hypothetical protein